MDRLLKKRTRSGSETMPNPTFEPTAASVPLAAPSRHCRSAAAQRER